MPQAAGVSYLRPPEERLRPLLEPDRDFDPVDPDLDDDLDAVERDELDRDLAVPEPEELAFEDLEREPPPRLPPDRAGDFWVVACSVVVAVELLPPDEEPAGGVAAGAGAGGAGGGLGAAARVRPPGTGTSRRKPSCCRAMKAPTVIA